MRKAVIAVVGMVILLMAGVVITGYLLPVDHTATRSVVVSASPERVFAVLTARRDFPVWRSDVDSVDILPGSAVRWQEHNGGDTLTFEEVESRPPSRLVTRIADDSLPFGGTWTYDLVPEGSGTRVTITENGHVFNPVFRFVSRFIIGHTATMNTFLADLTKRLSGPDAAPRH